ncbi:MAG: hypothetical protein KatS3mg087_1410 [Patescibacteria group bacterium]|nr:MAG: hypothetical protein KatS3mg087_1410 [Patescibacteria group bacterium]
MITLKSEYCIGPNFVKEFDSVEKAAEYVFEIHQNNRYHEVPYIQKFRDWYFIDVTVPGCWESLIVVIATPEEVDLMNRHMKKLNKNSKKIE